MSGPRVRPAIVAGRLALVAVLVPAVPRSADAQWVEPLRASRVTVAVDGHPSGGAVGSDAAERAHRGPVPQFILCIRHPVGRAASGAAFGGAVSAAAAWILTTLIFEVYFPDGGEKVRRARRGAIAASATAGAVHGAFTALAGSDECVAPPPDLRLDDPNPGS